MKRLKKGLLVLVRADDWHGEAGWTTPDGRRVKFPVGNVIGIVDSQDDRFLTLCASWFDNDPEDIKDGGNKIPVGCIQEVYELVIRKDPIWAMKKGKKHEAH